MGVGRRLREARTRTCKVFAAEPHPGERVQGLRSLDEGFMPEIFDPSVLDGKFLVTNAESIDALRELTRTRASSRASRRAACWSRPRAVAEAMESGTIVALLADGGWKYLSEDICGARPYDGTIEALNLW